MIWITACKLALLLVYPLQVLNWLTRCIKKWYSQLYLWLGQGISLHFYGYILKNFYNECFWKIIKGMGMVSSIVEMALSLVRVLRVEWSLHFPTDIWQYYQESQALASLRIHFLSLLVNSVHRFWAELKS